MRARTLLWSRHRALVGVAALLVASAGSLAALPGASTSASTGPTARALLSSSQCAANRAAGPMTFVSPFSFDASDGIIDVFAAQSLGYFANMCLTVRFVTSSYTPIELVATGQGTVTGEGSAADDLTAAASGSNVVGVATYGDTSDYALLTVPTVSKLTQLEGKVLAYHTVMPVVLSEMLRKAGVDTARVDEINDNTYDPNLLFAGRFQALQAYQSNEPITLRAEHKAFNEFTPAQFGVKGTFNVQIVNGTFLKHHPVAVADFVRAELHAFDYCVAHGAACVALEKKAAGAASVSFDSVHALAEWRFESALAEHNTLPGQGVGVESQAEWTPEAAAVRSIGAVKSVPPLSVAEDTTLAASLYNAKTLIWP